jgi:protease I
MNVSLGGRRVAFLFTDGVEQAELLEPMKAVRAAGGETVLVSPKQGGVQMVEHDEPGDVITTEVAAADADPEDFDALVLPGGVANPDRLRTDPPSVAFVRAFFTADKPVAAVCHGPWMLAEADVAQGRTMTSWPSLRTDLRNAGATWVDRELCVDRKLVTSRKPADLPAFCAEMVRQIAEARGRHPIAL